MQDMIAFPALIGDYRHAERPTTIALGFRLGNLPQAKVLDTSTGYDPGGTSYYVVACLTVSYTRKISSSCHRPSSSLIGFLFGFYIILKRICMLLHV